MSRKLEKILYVEDEADIRLITQIALEDIGGFIVEMCEDGYKALEIAETFAPDLLLLDVMMPGLDGPATLKALRELPSLKDTPAMFMTARVRENEIEQYKKLGILDIISKPFEPMTLAETIRQRWSKHYGK